MIDPRIIVNLFFLKNTNGMYFYAKEYICSFDSNIKFIIVNERMFDRASLDFKNQKVIKAGWINYLYLCIKVFLFKYFVYTPTPHPIPFIRKQLVVLHDPYPFIEGKLCRIKFLLFIISCFFSRCWLGFINNSDSKEFLDSKYFSLNNKLFVPNYFSINDSAIEKKSSSKSVDISVIGLFGTDSKKKNYELLFDHILKYDRRFSILIYGHENEYYINLKNKYKEIDLSIIESASCTFEKFIEHIDVVISVADKEGFGRPIAFSLAKGIPCLLIKSRTFEEFFGESAMLFDDVHSLCIFLNSDNNLSINKFRFPEKIDESFRDFVKIMKMVR